MNPIIIHHRSVHHAVNSGYSRLIDYIPNVSMVRGAVSFPYRLAKFISKNINQHAGNYDSSSVLKEIELFKLLRRNKNENKTIHYLNAERDIRQLIQWKSNFKNTNFSNSSKQITFEIF